MSLSFLMRRRRIIISSKNFLDYKIKTIQKRIMDIGRLYSQINGRAGTIAWKQPINLILSGKISNLVLVKEILMDIVALLAIKVKFQVDCLINKR